MMTARPRLIVQLVLTTACMYLSPEPLRGQAAEMIGADVYAKNCANQYCHGAAGAAGAAKALIGRGLSPAHVSKVIREGVKDTSMPGWEKTLSAEDLDPVIAYVMSLQSAEAPEEAQELDPSRPWLDHPGRALFFDAGRVGACGACHEFDALGIAVAPPVKRVPSDAEALRGLDADAVQTVEPSAEDPFPGIAVAAEGELLRFYDLGSKIPVLRTYGKDSVAAKAGSVWRHRHVLEIYSDQELGTILGFLRQAIGE